VLLNLIRWLSQTVWKEKWAGLTVQQGSNCGISSGASFHRLSDQARGGEAPFTCAALTLKYGCVCQRLKVTAMKVHDPFIGNSN